MDVLQGFLQDGWQLPRATPRTNAGQQGERAMLYPDPEITHLDGFEFVLSAIRERVAHKS